MSGFLEVNVEIVVGHDGASHRGNADGFFVNAEFFNHFGDDAVHGAVTTARAIVETLVRQQF